MQFATPTTDLTDAGGLVGFAATLIDRLGEVGAGLFTLLETVFPPIPSEVILPLAGALAQQGKLNFAWVIVATTVGAYVGALGLYALAAKLGQERSITLLSKLPLVDREDFEKATAWFVRHGRSAVFFGRLIPGVRSLISLPAGAAKMPLLTFSVFTIAGSGLWNSLLVSLGALLGSQYHLIEQYTGYIDYIVYAVLAGIVVWLIVRRVRRVRAAA
ncbi:MAG: associated Golgi protein [Alphaproteobacteria bacterium]|nr:associated Golgi protein [Alphaproteobacteria bacterium]